MMAMEIVGIRLAECELLSCTQWAGESVAFYNCLRQIGLEMLWRDDLVCLKSKKSNCLVFFDQLLYHNVVGLMVFCAFAH